MPEETISERRGSGHTHHRGIGSEIHHWAAIEVEARLADSDPAPNG